MKLDMGRAWNDATALISGNKDVIGIIAGVFFFLPYLATSLLLPDLAPPALDPEDSDAMVEALIALYADNWWIFVLTSILQMIGMLALFALLTDRARPTVGEALKRGAVGFPTYLIAQIISGLAIAALFTALALITPILAVLAFPVLFYVMVKLCLIGPVIGIEQNLNPITVLIRSWRLTKGNSFRIFFFFVLLFLVFIVISVLVTLIVGVIFAAIGGQIELIGNALVGSLVNAVFVVIYLAVLASIHRHLAGPNTEALNETFN